MARTLPVAAPVPMVRPAALPFQRVLLKIVSVLFEAELPTKSAPVVVKAWLLINSVLFPHPALSPTLMEPPVPRRMLRASDPDAFVKVNVVLAPPRIIP